MKANALHAWKWISIDCKDAQWDIAPDTAYNTEYGWGIKSPKLVKLVQNHSTPCTLVLRTFLPVQEIMVLPNPKSPNFETPELLGLSTRPKSASLHPVMARDLIHVTDLFKEVFSWFTWACPFPSSSPIIFSPKDLNSRIICVNTRLFRKSTHHCVWGFLNPSLLKDTNFSLIVTQFSSTSHHHSSASACAGSP